MRKASLLVVICLAALLTASTTRAFDLGRVLALGCGDACGTTACCGSEVGCGCEPACGCGDGYSVNGRQFAGDTWTCCRECGPPICECTGPSSMCGGGGCGDVCGCGEACEPGCGCEPACGCGPAGGSSTGGKCICGGLFFHSWCGRAIGCVDKFCGCTGCDGELYWNEWHNDPPRCCDPCDNCGNWIGPAHGSYRAPYDHPYNVAGPASGRNIAAKAPANGRAVVRKQQSGAQHPVNPFRTPTRGITRKPDAARDGTYRR